MSKNESGVTRIPITWHKRLKNKLGRGAVPCMEGEYIVMSVMTIDSNDKERKLCELVVTREDLLGAISSIKPPSKKA
jgi:hypothetical protein